MWQDYMIEACAGLNVEPSVTSQMNGQITGLEFRCPRELNSNEIESISRHLPSGMKATFVVSPKTATLEFLTQTMKLAGIRIVDGAYNASDRSLKMLLVDQGSVGLPEEDSLLWAGFIKFLKLDGAIDEWDIFCKNASGEVQVIQKDVKNFLPPSPEKVKAFMDGLLADMQEVEQIERATQKVTQETKPERITRIGDDDITNLKISLETSQDVNDFLKGLE